MVYHVLQGFPAEGTGKSTSASMVGIIEGIFEENNGRDRYIQYLQHLNCERRKGKEPEASEKC